MCGHCRYANTLLVCLWRNVLGLACCACVDRVAGTNMCHGLRGPFHASITIGMGVIFVITNRVNMQIILQTKVGITKVTLKF